MEDFVVPQPSTPASQVTIRVPTVSPEYGEYTGQFGELLMFFITWFVIIFATVILIETIVLLLAKRKPGDNSIEEARKQDTQTLLIAYSLFIGAISTLALASEAILGLILFPVFVGFAVFLPVGILYKVIHKTSNKERRVFVAVLILNLVIWLTLFIRNSLTLLEGFYVSVLATSAIMLPPSFGMFIRGVWQKYRLEDESMAKRGLILFIPSLLVFLILYFSSRFLM